jgi:phage terminase small subunit
MNAEERLARAPQLPPPPKHLSASTKRWWHEVVRSFELEAHHLQLLELACEARDRAEQARAKIAEDGAFIAGRYGLRAHPAVAVERDSRLAFARLLRELDLDVELPAERKPPALRRYN